MECFINSFPVFSIILFGFILVYLSAVTQTGLRYLEIEMVRLVAWLCCCVWKPSLIFRGGFSASSVGCVGMAWLSQTSPLQQYSASNDARAKLTTTGA